MKIKILTAAIALTLTTHAHTVIAASWMDEQRARLSNWIDPNIYTNMTKDGDTEAPSIALSPTAMDCDRNTSKKEADDAARAREEKRKMVIRSKIDTTCVDKIMAMKLGQNLGLTVPMADPYAILNDLIKQACTVVEGEITKANALVAAQIANLNSSLPQGPFGPIKVTGGVSLSAQPPADGKFVIDAEYDTAIAKAKAKNMLSSGLPTYTPPPLWK